MLKKIYDTLTGRHDFLFLWFTTLKTNELPFNYIFAWRWVSSRWLSDACTKPNDQNEEISLWLLFMWAKLVPSPYVPFQLDCCIYSSSEVKRRHRGVAITASSLYKVTATKQPSVALKEKENSMIQLAKMCIFWCWSLRLSRDLGRGG